MAFRMNWEPRAIAFRHERYSMLSRPFAITAIRWATTFRLGPAWVLRLPGMRPVRFADWVRGESMCIPDTQDMEDTPVSGIALVRTKP